MAHDKGSYYLPSPSHWPLVGSIGLFCTTFGFAMALPKNPGDPMSSLWLMFVGMAILAIMMFGWFGTVIRESQAGKYNDRVDMSFRMGMGWFIFSEVMFFAAFFGALYYIWQLALPWLSGDPTVQDQETHKMLWSSFNYAWPMLTTPVAAIDSSQTQFLTAKDYIHTWAIPTINTLILITSSFTVTFAHWALKKGQRGALNLWMLVTVALGATFLYFQATEYIHAYKELNLTLQSGGYATTFFMLTGFHGLHVTIGTLILIVLTLRCFKGHFTAEHHFGFEAGAWYWHFVDVVWICLYIIVYVIPEHA